VSGSPALYGYFTWRMAAATRARTVIIIRHSCIHLSMFIYRNL